ncbi:MAG: hypothetical protein JXR37_02825 [Kiritimatiellae bacterium]|nr:hypothetical protein [Kiritimatiellia bacterium]
MASALDVFLKATNLDAILKALSSGALVRKTLGTFFQVAAVVLGLFLLVKWFPAWGFMRALGFFGWIGYAIWQLVFLYAAFLAVKVLFIRAGEVKSLPDSDYVVMPIVAILFKALGEMAFVALGVMSVPAMILRWLGGEPVRFMFQQVPIQNAFLAGIFLLAGFWVLGFFAVVATRLSAEWTLAIFSIANDVNRLRRHAVDENPDAQPAESGAAE